ncbi:signal recognition particle receptor subunit beta-like [Montipora capricornis]|uniref:signal recognition particle receptor subunit beta-like n=1 Tax=Montipora capricornis TaxID=246305 RepID=UPI0035F1B178
MATSVRSWVIDSLEGPNATVYGILIATLIVILTAVLYFVFGRNRSRGRSILLIGLTDSGKTLLFSRLSSGKYVMTHTSIKENKDQYRLKGSKSGKVLDLIDLPGHERVRARFLEQYKNQTRGILFVVDSVNFPREQRDVAEIMYDILGDKYLSKSSAPILVVCNKQDLTMAKSQSVIKPQLEKEINTIRITRAAALQGQDGGSTTAVYVGKKDKEFEFSHVLPVKVEFAECSAKGQADGEADLTEVEKWLEKIA